MIEYTVKVYGSGDRFWFLNGKYHREDGPAVELNNGNKEWWLNGERHREDGPACESSNGTKEWYVDGERHREDGPACEYSDGGKEWFLNGKGLTEEEFLKKTKRHVIIIDGKEIEISSESYKELQKSLN